MSLSEKQHSVDVCVVGGGLAGIVAALSAARHGASVLLMQDRPMLGGNSSSETRVSVGGADRGGGLLPNLRETGIIEELRLDNSYWNPLGSFSLWDMVLHQKAQGQDGLTLLLNCSCMDAEMDGDRITVIKGWQTTTQTFHRVKASIFIDCSGDSILAPLSRAKFRMGREGRSEYGEPIAPLEPDACTMGMTCYFWAKEYDTPQPFTAPSWAYTFDSDEELPYGAEGHAGFDCGYWTTEFGGRLDAIRDAEEAREELLRIIFGLWDHIKNRGDHGADNWALDWVQFLPAKRESRRYIGDHVLTQLDIEAGGRFDDIVAYGGWEMDDHYPAGFWSAKEGQPSTIFHPAPSPYGIPYRILYSQNIENLMFSGRNTSCTHTAMSSTRLQATCSVMGQAAGTAAAMAAANGLTPRGVGEKLICELQEKLLRDDCYLPGLVYPVSELTRSAAIQASVGDPEPVRDGVHRAVGEDDHFWECPEGGSITYRLGRRELVHEVTLVLDSSLDKTMGGGGPHCDLSRLPGAFRVERYYNGRWYEVLTAMDNFQRLLRVEVNAPCEAVRFVIDATRGGKSSRLYAFYID